VGYASVRRIVARTFEQLVAWKLAYELKCEVFAFTGTGPASRDFKFLDQIRDASASAPRNIAEGFGRFRPAEFARFLEYARGSLMETRNHLIDGRDRGYLDAALHSRLTNLELAARRATTRLLLANKRHAAEEAAQRRHRTPPRY
jgi:four helix bundle protein